MNMHRHIGEADLNAVRYPSTRRIPVDGKCFRFFAKRTKMRAVARDLPSPVKLHNESSDSGSLEKYPRG